MNNERHRHLDKTLFVGGLALIASGKYYVDGMVISARSGGIKHTIHTSLQFLENIQRFNWNEAAYIASVSPNEMEALLSFTISAACGLAALGVGVSYAHYEANLE